MKLFCESNYYGPNCEHEGQPTAYNHVETGSTGNVTYVADCQAEGEVMIVHLYMTLFQSMKTKFSLHTEFNAELRIAS